MTTKYSNLSIDVKTRDLIAKFVDEDIRYRSLVDFVGSACLQKLVFENMMATQEIKNKLPDISTYKNSLSYSPKKINPLDMIKISAYTIKSSLKEFENSWKKDQRFWNEIEKAWEKKGFDGGIKLSWRGAAQFDKIINYIDKRQDRILKQLKELYIVYQMVNKPNLIKHFIESEITEEVKKVDRDIKLGDYIIDFKIETSTAIWFIKFEEQLSMEVLKELLLMMDKIEEREFEKPIKIGVLYEMEPEESLKKVFKRSDISIFYISTEKKAP